MGVPQQTTYCCPGETQPISRSIHLARLACFYPACRECPSRNEVGSLSTKLVRQLEETRRHLLRPHLWYDEGLAGVFLNQIDARVTRRAALAFGSEIDRLAGDRQPTCVVLASDGRSLTAELVEAAIAGLRYAGCSVVDIGFATGAALAHAVVSLAGDGGLLIGNALSCQQTVSLNFWGRQGQPFSRGGQLEAVRSKYLAGVHRPTRGSGTLCRQKTAVAYVEPYKRWFHALRPLRVGLETSCIPFRQHLTQLTNTVACQFQALPVRPTQGAAGTALPPTFPSCDTSRAVRFPDGMHFSCWVDGDGERCLVWDEQGSLVAGSQLLLLMARQLLIGDPGATVVLEEATPLALEHAISQAGGCVIRSAPSREAMYSAVRDGGGLLGGGDSGRFWFSENIPMADALQVIALLLTRLSQSDHSLSEVL